MEQFKDFWTVQKITENISHHVEDEAKYILRKTDITIQLISYTIRIH